MLGDTGLRRRRQRGEGRKVHYLDVTAFVDVVFFLLFFFLLTFNLTKPEGFSLAIPSAKASKVKERGIRVMIPIDGNYSIDGQRFTPPALEAFLRRQVGRNKDIIVHLVADKKTPSQRLVTALDIATRSGVKNALLRTEQPAE